MRAIILTLFMLATVAWAGEIIPVAVWPRTINLPDKQIVNASVADCVAAGYRMIPAKPTTPTGKQIKSEKFVQDDKDASMCKYEIVYEDIPAPPVVPPVVPEVLTNVAPAKCLFVFTTNGAYRGVTWIDAPKSNAVTVE